MPLAADGAPVYNGIRNKTGKGCVTMRSIIRPAEPAARRENARGWLILLAVLFLIWALPAAGRTETAHSHAWEESSRIGQSIVFRCADCGEKRTVFYETDTGPSGYFLISLQEGGGGAPVTMRFQVRVDGKECEAAYRWYECGNAEGESRKLLPEETGSACTTPAFSEPGIRFFACEAEARFSLDGREAVAVVSSDVFKTACTGLPTILVETAGGAEAEILRDEYTDASFRLIPGAGDAYEAVAGNVRIKGRGNYTWSLPKRGYTDKFAEKQDLLGMGKAKKWTLLGNYADRTLMRNWFASVLASEVCGGKDWTPEYRFADLVLNGVYQGNYCLATPVTISKSRINIQPVDEIKADVNRDGRLDAADGGYILEVDAHKSADRDLVTAKKVAFTFHDPDLEGKETGETADAIRTFIQETEDMLYAKKRTGPRGGMESYFDLDSVIGWYLVNEITRNQDATFFSSVFLYYDPEDALLHMGPIWDFDLACGNSARDNEPEGFQIRKAKWISAMFKHPVFTDALQSKWALIRENLQQAVRVRIPEQAERIRVSAELNFLNWEVLGSESETAPAGYEDRLTWQSEIDYMTDWLEKRTAWFDEAMRTLTEE